ncbi:MAG: HD domain-containing protein [Bacteroidetes bacterium]|nr:HD domain-containing protein [Bacteroidota bacterium]
MDFAGARDYILDRLRKELSPTLTYHTVDHTLDMHRAVVRLMDMEQFTDEHERTLIETAAVFHDAGMLHSYKDHEIQSVKIAKKVLPAFRYTEKDIDEISKLILVTKLPQNPNTLPEKILCDADLDSLGRVDFFQESFELQLEWKLNNIRQTTLEEWLRFEVCFFSDHEYFTHSGRELRREQKKKNLAEITDILERLK